MNSALYKEVKIPDSQYIELYCDLAHAMLEQSAIDRFWLEDEGGNETYTPEGQDMFDHFVGIVEYILEQNGIARVES